MSAVVYTAIAGGYDELKQPVAQDTDCEFVCFTDAAGPARVGAWRMVRFEADPKVHPRLRAKRFKILSHEYFRDGRWKLSFWSFARRLDVSIWVDGSLAIESPRFVSDMRARLGDGEWAMFAHPDRDCIYEEAELSATLPKYQGLPIREHGPLARVRANGGGRRRGRRRPGRWSWRRAAWTSWRTAGGWCVEGMLD